MKTALDFRQKFVLIFLGMMALFFISGCQDEIFEPENVDTNTLKNGVVITPANGTLSSGALYDIQLPSSWNDDTNPKILLVYAHGYVDFDKPVDLPADAIPDGAGGEIPIPYFVTTSLEMGYATTSYRDNGLIVPEAVEDILLLRAKIVEFYTTNAGSYAPPQAIILVGPSEGGLITTLTVEQNPGLFTAAVATCCPIGNFYDQLQYYGDAHVLFRYFFGHTIEGIPLGTPIHVPDETIAAWNSGALPNAIIKVLTEDYLYNNGAKVNQFLSCAKIPADRTNPEMVIRNIVEVMRFAIKATNDAICRLDGNPFNNKAPRRIYTGSDDDENLNLTVDRILPPGWEQAVSNIAARYGRTFHMARPRFHNKFPKRPPFGWSDDWRLNMLVERIKMPNWKCAVKTIEDNFETSGILQTPLVIVHGQYDHIALEWHQAEYIAKVAANPPSANFLTPVYIPGRYGHCNFTASEIGDILNNLVTSLPQ